MTPTIRINGERASINFKRRGRREGLTPGAEAYARELAARRIHQGPEFQALLEALSAVVAAGLARTISRVRS